MISLDVVALVHERSDLVELVRERVPSLMKGARAWIGACPFHEEHTTSLHVSEEKQFFHCFECKASGNAIDFVVRDRNCDLDGAVRFLAARAGVSLPGE